MGNRHLGESNFEDWIEDFFGTHSDMETVTVGMDELRDMEESPHDTISNLTHLFLHAHELLKHYSDEEVSRGLHHLASNNFSDTMYALLDEEVPWLKRQTCIQSMYTLFKDFFAHRCSPELSFPPERTLDNPLNFISCHWFDLMPFHGRRDRPHTLNMEFLDVFRKVLTIDSGICQEGALTGLGSWRLYYPEEADQILDEFLSNNPELNLQLREHVAFARRSLNIL